MKRYRISNISNTVKAFIGLSAAGIGIAGYHSYDEIVHYSTKVSNACQLNSVVNCASGFAYSHPFGIPLYVFGIVWFPLILIISIVMRREFLGIVMLPLLMVGNLFTLYLWYLEIDVVYKNTGTICPVCVSMYVVNYILTALVVIKLYRSL